MKKPIFFFMAILMALLPLAAQERYINVYSGGTAVYSRSTTGSHNITFSGSAARFSQGGQVWTIETSSIDSVVFSIENQGGQSQDTVQVDTGSAVRIVWNGESVSVVNPYARRGITVSSSAGDVTVASTIDSANILYILSGSSTNGSLTLSSSRDVLIQMGDLSLTAPSSPAISIGGCQKATVSLSGTSTLCDGTASSGKGTLQAAGNLTFQGAGTLSVSGMKKHGIQSSGRTTINNGTLHILTAVKDGIHATGFTMNGGTVDIANSNGDGIDADLGSVVIAGGNLTIDCSGSDVKGLGSDSTLAVSGGQVNITLSGADSKGIKSDSAMFLAGGTIEVVSTGDTCKGISCNSTLTISNGTIGVTVGGLASKGIKADGDLVVAGGQTTVNANGTLLLVSSDPSYCTGVKVDGSIRMLAGSLASTCASTNAGGKAVSADGNISVHDGTLTLSATGACAKYLVSGSTYDSYSSQCLRSNGSISIYGGTVSATAGGRAINADGCYTQNGGTVITSTSASGFTLAGSGTSCTDGFAPACLKADSNITFMAGTFSATSTGTGGRGIVGDSLFTAGFPGAADSLLLISITTSGSPVNVSSGGGMGGSSSDYWKGLPKGIKIEGNITINSGRVRSYCSQTSGDATGEAIETKDSLFINGGIVEANAYDDAINAGTYIGIAGGKVWAYARGNDGMDCNGQRINVSGGTLICRGTEVAIDDNGDHGGKLYVSGGTIVLIGGNMGTTEATPSLSGQKGLTLGGTNGGGGRPGVGGSSSSDVASSGFTVKNSSGTEVLTFKWPTFTGSGFESVSLPTAGGSTGSKPGGPGQSSSRVWVTSPSIQSGSYTYYTSPAISGGTSWHGLYSGATVATTGNGNSITAQ